MEKIDLVSGWATIWGAVPGELAGVLIVAATAIAAWAVVKYVLDKRKGGGGNTKQLVWWLVLAVLLAIPNSIIPLVLKGISWLLNFAIGLFSGALS